MYLPLTPSTRHVGFCASSFNNMIDEHLSSRNTKHSYRSAILITSHGHFGLFSHPSGKHQIIMEHPLKLSVLCSLLAAANAYNYDSFFVWMLFFWLYSWNILVLHHITHNNFFFLTRQKLTIFTRFSAIRKMPNYPAFLMTKPPQKCETISCNNGQFPFRISIYGLQEQP